MKLIEYFDKFLENTVNLNKSRYETAVAGIDAITNFLKSNEALEDYFIKTSPQGSIKQKTIIKPPTPESEFDVDLLYEMEIVPYWEPKDYLKNVADQFTDSDRYKDLVDTKGKSRCVTIDYESDFHIDIVPAIKNYQGYWIMNKNTNEFEITDGDGYAQWFENQTVVTNGFLVETVRLMKYLRDINGKYSAKSILLTTLLGSQISTEDVMDNFPDLPSTFKLILERLDSFLQSNQQMPVIENPVLPQETFNRHWDQEKYTIFRNQIHNLVSKINEVYTDPDKEKSIEGWRQIFGDQFPSLDRVEALEESATPPLPLGDYSHAATLKWPEKIEGTVRIDAYLYTNDHKKLLRGINSDAHFASGYAILYRIKTNIRQPLFIYWQVVNTGEHAKVAGGLRGSIFPAYQNGTKLFQWESSLYTGRHWIECFIVKNDFCVARRKFFINVKNPRF